WPRARAGRAGRGLKISVRPGGYRGRVPDAASQPVEPVDQDSRGILGPSLLRERVRLTRYPPTPALDGLVDRFWAVRWDLPPGLVHRQQVLTHPGANLSIGTADGRPGDEAARPPEARMNGVARRLF